MFYDSKTMQSILGLVTAYPLVALLAVVNMVFFGMAGTRGWYGGLNSKGGSFGFAKLILSKYFFGGDKVCPDVDRFLLLWTPGEARKWIKIFRHGLYCFVLGLFLLSLSRFFVRGLTAFHFFCCLFFCFYFYLTEVYWRRLSNWSYLKWQPHLKVERNHPEIKRSPDLVKFRMHVLPVDRESALKKQDDSYGRNSAVLTTVFSYWPLENPFRKYLKRSFDICLSLFVILLILSWLVPVLALIIKLDSKGPVFFVQWRSGKCGKPFKCYKFRSMRVNSLSDSLQAQQSDSRFTIVGRILRRTSIDEMPQFFNVLINDMSVIGPRPHMLLHTEKYRKLLENYMIRHRVKPGITGWAQVNGWRGETRMLSDMEMRVRHDVFYLRNWSFLLDIKIVLRTIWILLHRDRDVF